MGKGQAVSARIAAFSILLSGCHNLTPGEVNEHLARCHKHGLIGNATVNMATFKNKVICYMPPEKGVDQTIPPYWDAEELQP